MVNILKQRSTKILLFGRKTIILRPDFTVLIVNLLVSSKLSDNETQMKHKKLVQVGFGGQVGNSSRFNVG